MNHRHFILATAGHVDHGKSSLVKALTGTDPDRLPEEKARGITIDLGFANLDLESKINHEPTTLRLGLVDVPGHEDFVKNMVAGVGSIDLALFVVAADDGWMPQTEEHLQILAYLGVTQAIVALTKIDLVQDEQAVIADVRQGLAGSPFAAAPIVPTSVISGRGLDVLKATLAESLSKIPPPIDIGKPRLWVDRVFVLRGIGTVVTGTLAGGHLLRGQAIVVQPSGSQVRIRSIQSHNRQIEKSEPGTRTALNLPDLDADTGIKRGDVITLPNLGNPTQTWDVFLDRSDREATSKLARRPLKNGTLIRIHIGSANLPAHLLLLEGKALLPGERGLAQVRFESKHLAFAGDRFIVRDWPEQATLAGGTVLNPEAERRHFRDDGNRKFLELRARFPKQAEAFVESLLSREGIAPRTELLPNTKFSAGEIEGAVVKLARDQKVVEVESFVADAGWWAAVQRQAAELIDAAHRAHPEQPGLVLTELRPQLPKPLDQTAIFDLLVRQLCQKGFSQVGASIRRGAHRPSLPPQLEAAGKKVRGMLSIKPFDPPGKKELAPDAASQQVLRFLVQNGEVIEVSSDIALLASNLKRAKEMTEKFLRERSSATAGELREALGMSRRIAIPFLEYLDRIGVTRRDGDKRFLKKP